jgi:hypothetical protein
MAPGRPRKYANVQETNAGRRAIRQARSQPNLDHVATPSQVYH